jgi:hypothetical protein
MVLPTICGVFACREGRPMDRRPFLLVLIAVSAFAFTAGTAAAKDKHTTAGAEAAFERFVSFNNNRQWGPQYAYLHPAQKAFITKDAYMACRDEKVPEGASASDIEFTDHYRERATIPGTEVRAKATALTVKFTVKRGLLEQSSTDTVHQFWVKNKWTFTLDADGFAACSQSDS